MANEGQKLDQILKCLDGLSQRLDEVEKRGADYDKRSRADARKRARADAEKSKGENYVPPLAGDRDDPDRKIDQPRQTAADNEGTANMTDDLPTKIARAKQMRDELNRLERECNADMRQQGPMCEAEEGMIADAQARADSTYAAFGKRAPAPLPGERLAQYRVRLLKPMKSHSKTWSDVDLNTQSGKNLDLIERQIYADAATFADSAENLPSDDALHPTTTTDPNSGHRVTTFRGRRSFVNQFKGEARLATVRDPREHRLRELLQKGGI
jgi:hypothetical protein